MPLFELPPDTPKNIRKLPREKRGFPIPFFVATQPDGTRDLRFACGKAQFLCVTRSMCWVCGQSLGREFALVGGPMAICNHYFSDQACHPSCARFSVKYCPHLANAGAKYRTNNAPEDILKPAGGINEHPGAIGILYTNEIRHSERGETLFAHPETVLGVDWYWEGQPITASEAAQRWTAPRDMPEDVRAEFRNEIRAFPPANRNHQGTQV